MHLSCMTTITNRAEQKQKLSRTENEEETVQFMNVKTKMITSKSIPAANLDLFV